MQNKILAKNKSKTDSVVLKEKKKTIQFLCFPERNPFLPSRGEAGG